MTLELLRSTRNNTFTGAVLMLRWIALIDICEALFVELSSDDRRRIEEEVWRMVAELRARPTQEKEDALGVEVAAMPAAEREFVTAVLLRMLGEGTS